MNDLQIKQNRESSQAHQSTHFFLYAVLDERQLRHRDTERETDTHRDITRVLFPFLLRGPRKTPLMLRKCPLLRCVELMTM